MQFSELGDDHTKALGKAVDQLPELDSGIGDADDCDVVMSEIIAHVREKDSGVDESSGDV